MSDRPILMSGPMVRALLEGRKTQTRRLAWREIAEDDENGALRVRYLPTIWQKVKVGDRLWVREMWAPVPDTGSHDWDSTRAFRADQSIYPDAPWARDSLLAQVEKWRPSIHMPRWASRITLVVTETRRERVQDIDEYMAQEEGVKPLVADKMGTTEPGFEYRVAYARLWNSLHGPGSWEANPEVVALTFTVHKRNIDEMEAAA